MRFLQHGWPVSRLSYSSIRLQTVSHMAVHVVAPAVGQVGSHAARADVVVVHPQAGDFFEESQQQLPVAPAINEHVEGAQVSAVGGQPQKV